MPTNLLENLDVFYGELTPARATVHARLEGLENAEGLSLSGFVRGPRCFYSKTLPATFRLQDTGPGPTLLAKSVVPDPSYWSPDTPHIYDVTVEVRKGSDVIASEVRQIGFKPLGISGRFFTWEGKPWVLRGVSSRSVGADTIKDWSDRSTCIVYFGWHVDEELMQQLDHFSSRGVLAWILVPAKLQHSTLCKWVSRFSRFPSVAGLVLLAKESTRIFTPDTFAAAPNLLLGDAIGNSKSEGDSRAKFICLKSTQGKWESDFLFAGDQPLVVFQELSAGTETGCRHPKSLEQARSACDKLQADLAPIGQFAGYIV